MKKVCIGWTSSPRRQTMWKVQRKASRIPERGVFTIALAMLRSQFKVADSGDDDVDISENTNEIEEDNYHGHRNLVA